MGTHVEDLRAELDRMRTEVMNLRASLAATEHERDAMRTQRDNAGEHAAGLGRILNNAGTPEDVIAVLTMTLLDNAQDAPNCTEWSGEYKGRGFSVSVQWADGKRPHALIDEARAERDAARAIIEGRTVAPTDAEARAHDGADGWWLLRLKYPTGMTIPATTRRPDATIPNGGRIIAWTPLDTEGRPCAWPVVAAKVTP